MGRPSGSGTMSGRLGTVLVASVGVTAGTAYFLLSDGGDSDVALARVDGAVVRAREEIDNLPSIVPGPLNTGSTSSQTPKAKELQPTAVRHDTKVSGSQGKAVEAPSTRRNAPGEVTAPYPARSGPGPDADTCPSCSGPRLWFYADKLGVTRLKRRFTPHPDE